jgi:hypothetical protein
LGDFTSKVPDDVTSTEETTSLTFANPAPGASRLFFRVVRN